MNRFFNLPIPPIALALLFAAPAFAGESHKCDTPVQECLNHMVTKLKTTGFIGIEYDDKTSSDGIVVTSIIPETAAEKAGIQVGDVLETLNGIRFAKDSYKEMAKVKLPGKEVTVTLTRNGASKTIKLTLAPMPADLMAKYIGEHMMAHASQKTTTAKK
jgi:predicted metalloprotease with PDZ domain